MSWHTNPSTNNQIGSDANTLQRRSLLYVQEADHTSAL